MNFNYLLRTRSYYFFFMVQYRMPTTSEFMIARLSMENDFKEKMNTHMTSINQVVNSQMSLFRYNETSTRIVNTDTMTRKYV